MDVLVLEIERIKNSTRALDIVISAAEREGKDLTAAKIVMDEIKSQAESAGRNLKNNMLDNAMENIANAKNMIERLRELLERIEITKAEAVIIPAWEIIAITALAASVIAIAYIKRKKIAPAVRSHVISLKKSVERTDKAELEKDREKLARMLTVLEKEKSEGIVSEKAYREMKKSMESRLSRLAKKAQSQKKQ